MRKKADVSIQMLFWIALGIIGFLVILPITTTFIIKGEEESAIKICKSSVVARANSAIGKEVADIKVSFKTFPLLCKTFEKKISGTKKEVMKQVADYMAKCWGMFSEGRFETTIDPAIAGAVCFPCYKLAIDDIKDADKIEWTEFQDWLFTNNITISTVEGNKLIKKQMSYSDYLTNYDQIPGFLILMSDIEEKKIYYVLYQDAKYKEIGLRTSEAVNGLYLTPIDVIPKPIQTGFGPIPTEKKECKILTGI